MPVSSMLLCREDYSDALHERNHFQDSTAARTVLAVILEIVKVSGDDLSAAYLGPQPCPMLKCFHTSATPLEQIHHVATCTEASKGEIRCWTCQKCHDFKRWHAVCATLKSPVELLRRLSNRKRRNNTSTGELSATKRGKVASSDEYTFPMQQESHNFENVWSEMEDPNRFFLHEVESTSHPAQLDANNVNIHRPSEMGDSSVARPLPTPPSSRDQSWSENSQNMVAYGDAKISQMPEQPPPYIVSPQTTMDEYQHPNIHTNNLHLSIPPVPYLQASPFMESPEDMEIPEADRAPWDDQTLSHETESPKVDLRLVPNALNTAISAQYSDSRGKAASSFSSSFAAPRIPNPHKQKQNTWPIPLHRSSDVPSFPPISQVAATYEEHNRQILDYVSQVTEEGGQTARRTTRTRRPMARKASFDAGTQDSITVSTLDTRPQGSRPPENENRTRAKPPRTMGGHKAAVKSQHEVCDLCGQKFEGIPKNRKQHLKRHVESTHGKVRFYCGHAGCRSNYNRVDNLHDHERKCHGFVLQPEAANAPAGGGGGGHGTAEEARTALLLPGGGSEIAELAGDAGLHEGGQYGVGRGSATNTGRQVSRAVETHIAVFGYPISTEEQSWGPAREEWTTMLAGVSGGSEGDEGDDPDGRHEDDSPEEGLGMELGMGLTPRPLDLPCAAWRV